MPVKKTADARTIKMFTRKIFSLFFIFLLLSSITSASEAEEIERGSQLVKSRVSCSGLNEEQLENIGEYYMELMHPGELHEIMDERLGGEGSESLELAHINIAKMMYCGERSAMPINMMNIMMNRGRNYNMMGYFGNSFNMMGYNYPFFGGFIMVFWLIVIFLVLYLLFKLITGQDFNKSKLKKRRKN